MIHGALTYAGPAQVAHKVVAEVRIWVSKLDLHLVTIAAASALHTLVEVAQFAARVGTATRRDCKIGSTCVADQSVASVHVFMTSRISSSLSHTRLVEGNRVTVQALLLDNSAINLVMSSCLLVDFLEATAGAKVKVAGLILASEVADSLGYRLPAIVTT